MNFFRTIKILNLNRISRKPKIGIEKVLRIWWRKNLPLEGKIIIFKILALSKFLFLAQVLPIPHAITTTCSEYKRNSYGSPAM